MFVCCECCVLSSRGLCDELITRPEESYRLCCVVVCNLENLVNEEALAHCGLSRNKKERKIFVNPDFCSVTIGFVTHWRDEGVQATLVKNFHLRSSLHHKHQAEGKGRLNLSVKTTWTSQ